MMRNPEDRLLLPTLHFLMKTLPFRMNRNSDHTDYHYDCCKDRVESRMD